MAPQMLLMEKVYQQADKFDVLHCHLDYWPFSLLSRQPTPYHDDVARPARSAGADTDL